MSRYLKILFLLVGVLCLTPSLYGQHKKKRVKRSNGMRFSFFDSSIDSLENTVMDEGFFYTGANYMNHVNSLGRDNDVNQWSLDPMAGFHKYNADVYVNGFRWSQTVPKWAETDIGISKLWQVSTPISVITTYEHAFIHYGTDDDKYGLNNLASAQFSWTNKIFDFDTRYEYDWGRDKASILELSIGHELDMYDVFIHDKVEITPRFYLTYLSNANDAKTFQTANYEIELPITWRKIGDIEWGISFNYAIPKNVLPEEGTGKPIFYMTSSLVKIFHLKNKPVKKVF